MKQCYQCGVTKLTSQFSKHKSSKDGLQPKCRQCDAQINREWRERNAEKRRLYHAQDRFVEARKRYKKEKPEVIRLSDQRRRARKYGADLELTDTEKRTVSLLYSRRDELTEWSGIRFEVDHIVPLSKGGRHHPSNLQLLPATENRRKGSNMTYLKTGGDLSATQ